MLAKGQLLARGQPDMAVEGGLEPPVDAEELEPFAGSLEG